MLFCLLRSQACRLLAAAEYAALAADEPAARAQPLYVGVASWLSSPAYFAANLLALLAGKPRPGDQAACDAYNQSVCTSICYSSSRSTWAWPRSSVAPHD